MNIVVKVKQGMHLSAYQGAEQFLVRYRSLAGLIPFVLEKQSNKAL